MKTPKQMVVDYIQRRGKLELLTGVIGAQSLAAHNNEIEKNREAESAHVRRELWGDTGNETETGDEMQQTILGDVTNPTPVVISGNNGSGIAGTLATLALGAALGGGGIAAGWLLNKAPDVIDKVAPVINDNERVDIGLGKLEDYLNQ